jgi:hypothetical protein
VAKTVVVFAPQDVLYSLWPEHKAALCFYMVLADKVTVEVPDPSSDGRKLGIVLGGTALNDADLAKRLGCDFEVVRHGRTELYARGLLVQRRYRDYYRLAIRGSNKWSEKNQAKLLPQYAWINEAIEREIADEPRSEKAVKPRSHGNKPRSRAVKPRSRGNKPRSQQHLGEQNQELKPRERAVDSSVERAEGESRGNNHQNQNPLSLKNPANGQEKNLELAEKVCARIALNQNIVVNDSLRDEIRAKLDAGHSEKDILQVIGTVTIEDNDRMPWKTIRDHLKYGLTANQQALEEVRKMNKLKEEIMVRERVQAEAELARIEKQAQDEAALVEDTL